jgi:peptidoglycan/xylan/chitin deacetylase (PgdA/CDA1 family)
MKLSISFDYDSPAGYRESFHLKDIAPDSDLRGTEALIEILAAHNAFATFGIVGEAALPGAPPEHCTEQIRFLHVAGHEVASHSFHHRYLPSMTNAELLADLHGSRLVLEGCIQAGVRGFIPPFNRPMHFPARGAISFSEVFGMHGRGRGRQSISSLFKVLSASGYSWSRVSFANKFSYGLQCLHLKSAALPEQPFLLYDVVAIPLHSTGFGDSTRAIVRRYLDSDLTLAIYGHPNQALTSNEQSAACLDEFLRHFEEERRSGKLQLQTMQQVELSTRQNVDSQRLQYA